MRRLVYISTATEPMEPRDLQKILRAARSYNSANLITGLLIFHEGRFFQVLEGEAEQVEKCYAHIQNDQRHENSILLSDDAIVARAFSHWWMSSRTLESLGHFQKKQFLELQAQAAQSEQMDLTEDLKINALLLAFLYGFRELDVAS